MEADRRATSGVSVAAIADLMVPLGAQERMDLRAIVISAHSLIGRRAWWTQGADVRATPEGPPLAVAQIETAAAPCLNMVGAIAMAAVWDYDDPLFPVALAVLARALDLPDGTPATLRTYNDTHSHAAVRAGFHRATILVEAWPLRGEPAPEP